MHNYRKENFNSSLDLDPILNSGLYKLFVNDLPLFGLIGYKKNQPPYL